MIFLSKDVIQHILKDGSERYPEECCGIIFGQIDESGGKTAEYAESAENAYDKKGKRRRFEITPEIMLNAERTARQKKLDIIGFYHSHPDCEAFPSEFDRIHALPVYSYIIMSVVKGKTVKTKSFVLSAEDMQFSEEKITICNKE
ncbi:MAG: Mov34/MPN/PAD-1 family protein [Oscillospiraceae bacterium]